jgi:hypothetical protein
MKDFDKKWQICVAKARQAPARSESPPLGFATRVLGQKRSTMEKGFEVIWERLALRLLAGVAVVLMVCAVLDLPNLRAAPLLKPGIENTVCQLVWKL